MVQITHRLLWSYFRKDFIGHSRQPFKMEVHTLATSTSIFTIEHLRKTFSTHGIPDTILSNNGSCFTSDELEHFCKMNDIKHITPSPYHPSSNGLAERAVQTVKEWIKRSENGTLETHLARFYYTTINNQHITL